jgi:hypothetical protein
MNKSERLEHLKVLQDDLLQSQEGRRPTSTETVINAKITGLLREMNKLEDEEAVVETATEEAPGITGPPAGADAIIENVTATDTTEHPSEVITPSENVEVVKEEEVIIADNNTTTDQGEKIEEGTEITEGDPVTTEEMIAERPAVTDEAAAAALASSPAAE